MKKQMLFLVLILPLWGSGQVNNLKLIDDAERKYLHKDSWRQKQRQVFYKELKHLINGKDTIYMHEVTKTNPHKYWAYIYTGNGDVIHLGVKCKGKPEKCGKPVITELKMHIDDRFHDDPLKFPPCYFEWFKTFDTAFLQKMNGKYAAHDDVPATVLIRIIEGQVDIFYTEFYFAESYDPSTGALKCRDLESK